MKIISGGKAGTHSYPVSIVFVGIIGSLSINVNKLRVRARITSHFSGSDLGQIWPIGMEQNRRTNTLKHFKPKFRLY